MQTWSVHDRLALLADVHRHAGLEMLAGLTGDSNLKIAPSELPYHEFLGLGGATGSLVTRVGLAATTGDFESNAASRQMPGVSWQRPFSTLLNCERIDKRIHQLLNEGLCHWRSNDRDKVPRFPCPPPPHSWNNVDNKNKSSRMFRGQGRFDRPRPGEDTGRQRLHVRRCANPPDVAPRPVA